MKASIVVSLLVGLAAGSYGQLPDPPVPVVTACAAGSWDLSWHGKSGRTFFLQYSETLEEWSYFPVVEFANDEEIVWGCTSSGSEFFLRLVYTDSPTSNPDQADFDNDGISNIDELQLWSTEPMNPDSDNDGITDGGEVDSGTNPNDSEDTPDAEIFVLTGTLAQDITASNHRTISIPPGEVRMLVVAMTSDEYPIYTGGSSDYNDILSWSVVPSIGAAMNDTISVNFLHNDWIAAEQAGHSLDSFSPTHVEDVEILQAPYDSPLTVDIDLSVTNIEDGGWPSTVIVASLPVDLLVPKLDANGDAIADEFVSTTKPNIAKWEYAFLGNHNNGSVRDDFIAWDPDRFYVRVPKAVELGITKLELATENNADHQNYNDDPTEATLSDVGDGVTAITDSMILVVDDYDDDFAGSGAGADDLLDDRTHKIQLDGELAVKSITIQGVEYPSDAKFKVPARYELDLDLYRINVASVHALAEIETSIVLLKEVCAQAGLRINHNLSNILWPNIPNSTPGILNLFDGPGLIGPLSADYKTFIDATDQQGVNLFILITAYASQGIAISIKQLAHETGHTDIKYLENAFINSAGTPGGIGYTSVHELLHILAPHPTQDDHIQHFSNVLNVINSNNDPVLWAKRLSRVQESRISGHQDVEEVVE